MRELKYIKLFEAFESSILSNTLAFIKDDQSKRDLKYKLEGILANIKDEAGNSAIAPMSLLKDEFFQYLPYKKALALRIGSELLECPRCVGSGKEQKAYGRGFRSVKCSRCDGTGKINPKPTLKYFKFWLDNEGNFVATTAVDGIYHRDEKDLGGYERTDISEYAKAHSVQEIKAEYGIVNGETAIYIENLKPNSYNEVRKSVICKAFIDRNGDLFGINSYFTDYSTPTGRKWKDFGNKSINIKRVLDRGISGEKDVKAYILKPGSEQKDLFWNTPVAFTGRNSFYLQNSISENFLTKAHAAIVFDFEKFREWFLASGEKSLPQIKGEREESKRGSLALMKGEDIRNANIERYLKIITNIDMAEGIAGIVRKITRIFGGKNAIFYIYSSINQAEFTNLIHQIYEFMETEDESQRKGINQAIGDRIKKIYDNNKSIDERIEKRLSRTKIEIANLEVEKAEKLKEIFDGILQLSKTIDEDLLRTKVTSIEDMVALRIKIKGMSEILNGARDRSLHYFLSDACGRYVEDTSMFDRLKQMNSAKTFSDLERIKRIINSLK